MSVPTIAPRIDSEIGPLRHVITHRPGRELDRLTPSNIHALLFDDVPWAARARDEHDQFVEVLASRGAQVHRFADLLAGALATAEGRRFVLDRTCTPERFGEQMARSVRLRLDDADPVTMADLLIGGVLKSELEPPRSPSLRWQALDDDDLVLAPLPNTLFQRDNSAWIASGVTVNPMAKLARQRESVHTRAVYRLPPAVPRRAVRSLLRRRRPRPPPGHARGRRRARARARRRAHRDGRAHHPDGGRTARPPTVHGAGARTSWSPSTSLRRARRCISTRC